MTDDFSDGARALDRGASTPLWAQLDTELRRRMEAGHFGERFPTDRELMAIYEVSRHTARHAVSRLGADGILRRARGVGTSVDRRTFERSLGSLYSLFQVVEESGVTQRSDVRALELVTDPEAAEHLGVSPDTPLVLLDRLRWAGDEPLAIDRIWLPADIAEPLIDVDFTRTSLYDELDRIAGDATERRVGADPSEHPHRRGTDVTPPRRRRSGVLDRTPRHVQRRPDGVAGHHDPRRSVHARRRLDRGPTQRAPPPHARGLTVTESTQTPQLHPDVLQVAHLIGTWSGRGHGEYPTIESFDYVETITFGHVGKPFLAYAQRTRRLLGDGSLGPPLHAESGYWRFPSPGRVELVVSHPTGITEVEEGTVEHVDGGSRFELATTSVARTASAKLVSAIERSFSVTGDVIDYRVRMSAVGLPLQHHLEATLERVPADG